jgi:hypothetical protein
MQRFGSPELTAPRVAWDAWLATHSGAAAVATRQAARLEALVRHARRSASVLASLSTVEGCSVISGGMTSLEGRGQPVFKHDRGRETCPRDAVNDRVGRG